MRTYWISPFCLLLSCALYLISDDNSSFVGSLDGELISPCMCKGTQQFVHRICLDHWRSVKVIKINPILKVACKIYFGGYLCDILKQEGFAFSHCTTCKAQFHLQVVKVEDNSWRKIKFRLFVARDVFLVFLAVQTVSICILFLLFF